MRYECEVRFVRLEHRPYASESFPYPARRHCGAHTSLALVLIFRTHYLYNSSYSGYLSTSHDTQHMFFYFFESRSNPDDDPLLMWLNGGPGCSSATGLFMELGPCRVNMDGNGTSLNEYGWNDEANVIFLDQPWVSFFLESLVRFVRSYS